MRRRRFGSTGRSISALGLGTWTMGGDGWFASRGPQDDRTSRRVIARALEEGVDWIDTAPAYGLGRAEELLGSVLGALAPDERPLVFTKCGLVWTSADRPPRRVLCPRSIRAECEASLQRLGLERLDLLQVHWPAEDGTEPEESWAALASLVDEGKVRWIGVSNYDVAMLDRCERVRHVDALQPSFSLLDRDAAADLLPWCRAHDVAVLAYSPLASGLLSGRFRTDTLAALAPDDWRRHDSRFAPDRVRATLRLVDALRDLRARHGCSMAALAHAWALSWPGVTATIAGARLPDQVRGWAATSAVSLSDEEMEQIARVLAETGAGTGPARPVTPPLNGHSRSH